MCTVKLKLHVWWHRYSAAKFEYLGIDNIHVVRDAFSGLHSAVRSYLTKRLFRQHPGDEDWCGEVSATEDRLPASDAVGSVAVNSPQGPSCTSPWKRRGSGNPTSPARSAALRSLSAEDLASALSRRQSTQEDVAWLKYVPQSC